MTVEQAKEAAKSVERLENLDKALDCIKIFEETVAGNLPDYCRLEIGSLYTKGKIDGIPDYIAVGMIEDLRKALEAEKFAVATKLGKM